MACFQTSSSSLPSMTGALSNFGRRTGFAFSGGSAGLPEAGPGGLADSATEAVGVEAGSGSTMMLRPKETRETRTRNATRTTAFFIARLQNSGRRIFLFSVCQSGCQLLRYASDLLAEL